MPVQEAIHERLAFFNETEAREADKDKDVTFVEAELVEHSGQSMVSGEVLCSFPVALPSPGPALLAPLLA